MNLARAKRGAPHATPRAGDDVYVTEDDPLAGAESVPLVTNFDALYVVRDLLGSGAFGRTYLIARRDTGRTYALKVLRRADPALALREVGALREFSAFPECRPHVICYHGVVALPADAASGLLRGDDAARVAGKAGARGVGGSDPGPAAGVAARGGDDHLPLPLPRPRPRRLAGRKRASPTQEVVYAIITDYIPGPTFTQARALMRNECDAMLLAGMLLDAVSVVHRAGYAHRDIKPDNVILSSEKGAPPRAVLIDFGLACAQVSAEGDPGVECKPTPAGDLTYAAPEVLAGRLLWALDDTSAIGGDGGGGDGFREAVGRAWRAADMYSVGATIYELITGETLRGDLGERFAPIGGVSPCFSALLGTLLDENPKGRPTVRQAQRRLRACAEVAGC